jgi:triacylglycerol lipase
MITPMRNRTTWHDLLHPGDATDFFARRSMPPFDPATSAYNAGNAVWLAELSRLIYRHDKEEEAAPPQPARTRFLEQAGFTQRHFFLSRETNTQAMLVEFAATDPFAVLVFRGSEHHIRDIITDLNIGKHSFGKSTVDVHEGFMRALHSVWHEIVRELDALSCPVFFTGHSLGAALATLATALRPPKATYTFGSPCVGDAAFVASLSGIAHTIHRVVDDADAVPTLPPARFGFRHVGTLHQLAAPASGEARPSTLGGLFGPPKLLADHAPVNYVDRI